MLVFIVLFSKKSVFAVKEAKTSDGQVEKRIAPSHGDSD